MFWIILFASLSGILAYLLFMRLEFCLNTYHSRYYLRIGHLGTASLERDPLEMVRLHLKVLFLNFYWRPSDLKALKRKPRNFKQRRQNKAGTRKLNWKRLARTFRVQSFQMEIDTGDAITNAQLYPLTHLLNYRGGDIRVNFCNRNQLLLKIVNRPIDILKAIMNH